MNVSTWGTCGCALVLASAGWAQVTQRLSVNASAVQGNSDSNWPTCSADGRFVTFASSANNLVPGDTNSSSDIFVRDRQTGIERVSVGPGGVQAAGYSDSPSISADGRYVAFSSSANNLVVGDTNDRDDVFVHDRQSGTTERVSLSATGQQANHLCGAASISADGSRVLFVSIATNLVPGDTNLASDVFVRDLQSGTTERVSVATGGAQAFGGSWISAQPPAISADHHFVVFLSLAPDLVADDSNLEADVFVRDLQSGTTERVSLDSGEVEGDGQCFAATISADGRYVAFSSSSTNLVPGDTNGATDVFLRDLLNGTTERLSVDDGGMEGKGASYDPSIAPGGGHVAFWSDAFNLVPEDTNDRSDVFLRDLSSGTTERVSVDSAGVQGNRQSFDATVTPDGRFVVFGSYANNFVPGDTNGRRDIFIRDRVDGTSFTSLCEPGAGGVIPCPCSNSPSGSGRGCDNSAATGGAILSATGGAFLTSDTLVFHASGEKPAALSIVLQGDQFAPTGLVFGQGVRCASGTLKRLYTKSAIGGSITAPSFGAGDPQVSVRSAALGDAILAGQSRWYLVYYRDPIVLGGCPPSSTFNATQTGEVAWSP